MKKGSNKIGIIVLVTIALIIGLIVIISIRSNRTIKNPDDVCGSNVGNLYNYGLFCEYDGYIYFSNPEDDGTLYRMTSDCTDIKKVYDDKVRYINADQNYLYYCRVNNLREEGGSFIPLYNTGIYRIKRNGSASLTSIVTGPAGALLLYGNTLYYQNYKEGEGLSLHSIGIDGKNDTEVSPDSFVPSSIYDGYLFVSNFLENRNLVKYKLPEMEQSTVLKGMTYNPIAVKTGIFFINVKNYSICRTDYTGKVTVIVDKPCSTYNISLDGRYLFYQADRTDKNYIGVVDLETMENRLILEGDFHNLNITSKYLFFSTLDDTTTYAYTTDGTGSLKILKLK